MKLLLGGGTYIREGFTNIDILPLPGVDIVADLTKGIPLPDSVADEILSEYLLSLMPDTVFNMEEMWRVCKPGARVVIKVPYHQSLYAVKDPTTKTFFTERTFEQFDHSFVERGLLPEYNLKCNFKIRKVTFNYVRRGTRFIPFIVFLRQFFWNVVKSIVVELEVIK